MRQQLQPQRQTTPKRITPLRIGIVFIVLLGLLIADLQFRGLIWQWIYDHTGEESILGQIQGTVELSGNLIRLPARTDALEAIQHTDIFPYGVNTFFEQETEIDKMNVQFQMIADAGFGWIRQEFPWEDIEVDGRGQFTDTRVDFDGDGEPDTINAWDKYDTIVDLADEYGLGMIVRLSNPPDWSRAENPDLPGTDAQPPDDYQDFVNYAVAVAERYQGRIRYYQVWNEPNIYPEWGEDFVNPADYTRLLCMTYNALKAVDPDIVVISGTIAPTASIDGFFGYHDLIFLQNIYDEGAGDCFDILSAQGYGLNSGPTDRRSRVTHLSYARHIHYRDIMVTNGDAHKPIWLSEVAWSPINEPCLQTGDCLQQSQIEGAGEFGAVTNEQAARYLEGAYDRARQEWSWIGHISYWHFTRPSINESNNVLYWFRMVEADYSPETPTFSPLPVYETARDYIADVRENPILFSGTHQAESWEITLSDDAQVLTVDDAQFEVASETSELRVTIVGTDVSLRYQGNRPILVLRDGEFIDTIIPAETGVWQTWSYSEGINASEARYTFISEEPFVVDSITIWNEFWLTVLPFICGIGAVLGAAIVLGLPILRYRWSERDNEARSQQQQQVMRQMRR
ncbi:MAG: hypothetical protein AAFV93_01290 [Chloroflexota bacterium]